MPVKARGKNRDCYNAGIHAAPKRGNKIKSSGVEEQRAFSLCCLTGKRCRNGASLPFELRIGQRGYFGLTVGEKSECDTRAVLIRFCSKQFGQAGKARFRIG